MNLNARPFQGHIQHLTLAPESQHHIGAFRTTDQLDGVLGGHAFGGGTIDGNDHILGLNARTGCRGALNRRDNNQLFRVFVETELDPHAHQLPGGVDLHLLELLRIKETRVGVIEAGQHAPDRLVGLGAAPIRLAQQIAPQLAPGRFVVGACRIQVIAINDLPDLINHLLGAVVNRSAGGRWQGKTWRADAQGGDHTTNPQHQQQRSRPNQRTQALTPNHGPSGLILQTNEIRRAPPSDRPL